jgi:hypothetical protein
VHCEQNGGKLELRTDASGGVAGVCILPDGSECDEWAYYRQECQPGDSQAYPEPTSVETVEYADDGCIIYRNKELGYSFHYPADAQLVMGDDPLKSINIQGTSAEDEYWPQITLSHPNDREDFRPPADADLLSWLTEHIYWAMSGPDQQLQDNGCPMV